MAVVRNSMYSVVATGRASARRPLMRSHDASAAAGSSSSCGAERLDTERAAWQHASSSNAVALERRALGFVAHGVLDERPQPGLGGGTVDRTLHKRGRPDSKADSTGAEQEKKKADYREMDKTTGSI